MELVLVLNIILSWDNIEKKTSQYSSHTHTHESYTNNTCNKRHTCKTASPKITSVNRPHTYNRHAKSSQPPSLSGYELIPFGCREESDLIDYSPVQMTEEHEDITKSDLMLVTVQYGQYFTFLVDSTPHSDLNSLKNTLARKADKALLNGPAMTSKNIKKYNMSIQSTKICLIKAKIVQESKWPRHLLWRRLGVLTSNKLNLTSNILNHWIHEDNALFFPFQIFCLICQTPIKSIVILHRVVRVYY